MRKIWKRWLTAAACLIAAAILTVAAGAAELPQVGIDTAEKLQAALDAGGTVRMTQDITGNVSIGEGVNAVLDLNGYVLYGGISIYGSLELIDSRPDAVQESLSYTDQIDRVTVYQVKGGAVTGVVRVDSRRASFYMNAGTLTKGSGIYVQSGTAVMSGGAIAGNIGAIESFENTDGTWSGCNPVYVNGSRGSFTMTGGTIRCNSCTDYTKEGKKTLTEAVQNRTDHGIAADNYGTVTIAGGIIERNVHGLGGALYATNNGRIEVNDGIISGNVAGCGGAVYLDCGTFDMSGGCVTENRAVGQYGDGGALSGWGSVYWSVHKDNSGDYVAEERVANKISITGGSITNNSADGRGGALSLPPVYSFELSGGARITGNKAGVDGGAINSGAVVLTIFDGVEGGPCIIKYPGEFVLADCVISGNTAAGRGGGIWMCDSENPESVTVNDEELGGEAVCHLPQGGIKVSGKAEIRDNTSGEDGSKAPDNVYLSGGTKIIPLEGFSGTVAGITTETKPTRTDPVVFTKGLGEMGDLGNFTGDETEYTMWLDGDGEALLGFSEYYITAGTQHGTVSYRTGRAALQGIKPLTGVTLTVTPDEHYELDTLTAKRGNHDVELTDAGDGIYTFDMPFGDVTVSAAFRLQKFKVTFRDHDGTELQSGDIEYGQTPVYGKTAPSRETQGLIEYTFAGWSDGSETYAPGAALPAVSGETVYTAVYDAEAPKQTLYVKAVDEEDGELEGALLRLLGPDGNEITAWTSDKTAKKLSGIELNKEYKLSVQIPPDGFIPASGDDRFAFDPYGKLITTGIVADQSDGTALILIEFIKTEVRIQAVDENGDPLSGATVQVIDPDGNVVDEWTSGSVPQPVEGLIAGRQYTLRETVAPEHYTAPSDEKFVIQMDNSVVTTADVGEIAGEYTVLLENTPVEYSVTLGRDPEAGGSVAGEGKFKAGTEITVTASAGDDYVFTGWYRGGEKVSDGASYKFEVQGDVALTAKFREKITYTLIWENGNGNALETKTYKEDEAVPSATEKIPVKAEDGDYTYTFDRWDGGVTEGTVTTYKPLFTAVPKPVYTLIWLDGDGSVLEEKTYKEGGQVPPPTDKTPVREEDAEYTYVFEKWDGGSADGNVTTYKPVFTAVPKKSPDTGDAGAAAIAALALSGSGLAAALRAGRRRREED